MLDTRKPVSKPKLITDFKTTGDFENVSTTAYPDNGSFRVTLNKLA